jgi:hypothetical protein
VSIFLKEIIGDDDGGRRGETRNHIKIQLAQVLFIFILTFVITHAHTGKREKQKNFHQLDIYMFEKDMANVIII